jgi:voltage-gated potassium channel Kch
VIRAILSPPVMIATLLVAAILTVAGTLSLWRQRRPLPAIADGRRRRRTERAEDLIIEVSTRILVLSAVAVALLLLY